MFGPQVTFRFARVEWHSSNSDMVSLNNVFVSAAFGPTLPGGWGLRGRRISIATAIQIMACSIPLLAKQQAGTYQGQRSSGAPLGQLRPAAER
jgi:hypothetical protein